MRISDWSSDVCSSDLVRDGRPFAALCLADFAVLPDAPAAVAVLKAAVFATVVVTNQPELARGNVEEATMEAMPARLAAAVPIDTVSVCTPDSGDRRDSHHPAPG